LTVPYPVILNHRPWLGLVGLLLHPVRIPLARKRTWRRLLSSRLVASRYPRPQLRWGACSGAGMHFRGAASLADVPFWRKLS